jgi:hypothetical protein
MICGLHDSKIGNNVIFMDYAVVQLEEVFMHDATVPFSEITGDT